MAFIEVETMDCDTTTKLGGINKKTGKPNPTSLEGYFKGTKDVTTSMGPAKLHIFKTRNGTVGVWGSAQLNQKLSSVQTGVSTRVTFTGTAKVPRGNMSTFKVEVDPSNTIAVSSEASQADSDYASEDSYEETSLESDDSSLDEVAYSAPVAPAAPAQTASAAQKAKIEALIKSRSARNSA